MAVTMIGPVVSQRMIPVLWGQLLIFYQLRQHGEQIVFNCQPMLPFAFALVVFLELTGALNRSHSNRPSVT